MIYSFLFLCNSLFVKTNKLLFHQKKKEVPNFPLKGESLFSNLVENHLFQSQRESIQRSSSKLRNLGQVPSIFSTLVSHLQNGNDDLRKSIQGSKSYNSHNQDQMTGLWLEVKCL